MLLESRAFCFQPFTSFLEKVVALCGIMEFQWNQIIATKNWHYIEPSIEKSIKIKNFYFHKLYPWHFLHYQQVLCFCGYDLRVYHASRGLSWSTGEPFPKSAFCRTRLGLLWGAIVHHRIDSGTIGLNKGVSLMQDCSVLCIRCTSWGTTSVGTGDRTCSFPAHSAVEPSFCGISKNMCSAADAAGLGERGKKTLDT